MTRALAKLAALLALTTACQAESPGPANGTGASSTTAPQGGAGATLGGGGAGSDAVDPAGAGAGLTCAMGQTVCQDACVSLNDSVFHCGMCGNACVNGRACVNGQCGCSTGLTDCSGACVDVTSDIQNCGVCGMACAASQGCAAGGCTCPGGATLCAGACIDTAVDVTNCGTCGNACVTGQQCSGGACQCQGGLTDCGGTCLDTGSDPDNCGACSMACSADQVCSLGQCAAGCDATLTQCGRSCVDTMTSAFHCGVCDMACGAGQSCVGGVCTCADGESLCDGQCVNTLTSLAHCGMCGNACVGGASCEGGTCTCPAGQTFCNGQCVDTQTSGLNCGGCGNICLTGCTAGTCPGVKDCAIKTVVATPTMTGFEDYDPAIAVTDWNFTFNAEPGMTGEVYAGPYQYSDETGMQTMSMDAGNASSYAIGISNTQASDWGGGLGFWMSCIDASAYDGLSFYARGSVPGGMASINLSMEQTNRPSEDDPATGGTCEAEVCEAPTDQFPVSSTWTRVLLPWASFTPGTAGTMNVPATGNNITGFTLNAQLVWEATDPNDPSVYAATPAGYELFVDDIGFFNETEVCPAGQHVCGSTCVDESTNAEHCGGCDKPCGGGQGCAGGMCTCPAGQTYCVDSCVDLQTSTSHCGGCGKVCALTATCSNGQCTGGNSTTSNRCGSTMQLLGNPLGCDFGWGANDGGSLPSYVDFGSKWVGYEQNIDSTCDGCGWLSSLASGNIVPMYYAYFIAYRANLESGLGDCNTDHDGNNLCSGGAQWIKSNRARILSIYSSYAQRSYQAYPSKPVIWLVEPDFLQYTSNTQSSPLSMTELGQLATDIVCAIKSNMPNAVIALTHSTWVAEPTYTQYWSAMPLDLTDLVHSTGEGNISGGYINDGDANNRNDGTWKYLHQLTGKPVIADTSFGVTTMENTWSSVSASTLNSRISDGVAGALVYPVPGSYQSQISGLASQLSSTCQ